MQITQTHTETSSALITQHPMKTGDISQQDKQRIVARLSKDFEMDEE